MDSYGLRYDRTLVQVSYVEGKFLKHFSYHLLVYWSPASRPALLSYRKLRFHHDDVNAPRGSGTAAEWSTMSLTRPARRRRILLCRILFCCASIECSTPLPPSFHILKEKGCVCLEQGKESCPRDRGRGKRAFRKRCDGSGAGHRDRAASGSFRENRRVCRLCRRTEAAV